MGNIRKFLLKKYQIEKGIEVKKGPLKQQLIEVIKVAVTQQPNTFDCGLYLLQFAELYYRKASLDQRFLFSPEIIALKRENLKITLLEKISIYKLGMAKRNL